MCDRHQRHKMTSLTADQWVVCVYGVLRSDGVQVDECVLASGEHEQTEVGLKH